MNDRIERALNWARAWWKQASRHAKFILIAVALSAAFLLVATAAHAQTVCDSHSAVIAKLEGQYKEAQTGVGLASNGTVAQLYVSESGSWTMLLTNARGVACLIAAGQGWESEEPNYPPPGPEEES